MCAAVTADGQWIATRLLDAPIVGPETHSSIGVNIQGPSLIRVPEWVDEPLGRYYLYFADHKGAYIRLAYADALTGPWQVHVPGSLRLESSHFPSRPPPLDDAMRERLQSRFEGGGGSLPHDLVKELTTPHIASPDVHVDTVNQRIVMYFHGLEAPGSQITRVATSVDGIVFDAHPEVVVERSYLRVFDHGGQTYGMAMPGQLYRSRDGFKSFKTGPLVFNANMRHFDMLQRGDTLHVFWTQVGEAPERILVSTIDLAQDFERWTDSVATEVLRPERPWEGVNEPLTPSIRSVAYGTVNQLRDPAVFEEDGRVYLLYAVAGESGIGIAELEWADEATVEDVSIDDVTDE